MVTKNLLQIICFNIFITTIFPSYSIDLSTKVVTRNKRGKLRKKSVVLNDLINKNFFEGKYFKIVYSKSDDAISTNDSELALRAASVYYHLQIARNYFKTNFGESSVSHLGKMIIRLEMNSHFSDAAHYMHDNHGHRYNDAVTVPSSNSEKLKLKEVKGWNTEIWFRPGKKEKVKWLSEAAAHSIDNPQIKEASAVSMTSMTLTQLGAYLSSSESISNLPWENHLETLAVGLGFTFIFPKIIKFFGRHVKAKYKLDTAMIPEIVFHEFTHAALSNMIAPNESTSVTEGLANYFAVKIAKSDKIAFKAGKYSRNDKAKKVKNRTKYNIKLETNILAQSDFTLKLLYRFDNIIGNKADLLIYKAVKSLNLASKIKYDLVNSLNEQIDYSDLNDKRNLRLKFALELDSIGL